MISDICSSVQLILIIGVAIVSARVHSNLLENQPWLASKSNRENGSTFYIFAWDTEDTYSFQECIDCTLMTVLLRNSLSRFAKHHKQQDNFETQMMFKLSFSASSFLMAPLQVSLSDEDLVIGFIHFSYKISEKLSSIVKLPINKRWNTYEEVFFHDADETFSADVLNITTHIQSIEWNPMMQTDLLNLVDYLNVLIREMALDYLPQPPKMHLRNSIMSPTKSVDAKVRDIKRSRSRSSEDKISYIGEPRNAATAALISSSYSQTCSLLGSTHAAVLNKINVSIIHVDQHRFSSTRVLCGIFAMESEHTSHIQVLAIM